MLSLILTLCLLYAGNGIRKHVIRQRMALYAAGSARASDGAANRVVMDGLSGAVGSTYVSVQYLEDGYIRVSGANNAERNGWKTLSAFTLEPGTYTLTGFRGLTKNTVALELRISKEDGSYRWISQWDEDVTFTVSHTARASLRVRVYPGIGQVDAVGRPAVYRDE